LVEQILALHEQIEPPEGHQAEVIEGNIVVSPSRSRRHGLIFAKLHEQLSLLMPAHLVVTSATVTVAMTATGERYIPDVLVTSQDALDSDEWLLPADQAELVAEIVSTASAQHDRVIKLRGYAASRVPIYLLIDPLERSVSLFSQPAGESYREIHRVPFGASIELPAPYQGKIDTGSFA
jgi:Uma2 family endonuclease